MLRNDVTLSYGGEIVTRVPTGSSIFVATRLAADVKVADAAVRSGHWAAGRGGQSWQVGKRLRLRSCDWPETPPGGLVTSRPGGNGGEGAAIGAKERPRRRKQKGKVTPWLRRERRPFAFCYRC